MGLTPKFQIVDKMNRAALDAQPLLTAHSRSALPMLSMIGQLRFWTERSQRNYIASVTEKIPLPLPEFLSPIHSPQQFR